MKNVRLADGNLMPMIGLGTWDLRGDACKSTVKNAINLGYIHIDTAWLYQNQREIGQAINESHINRDNLFITSKIWRTELSYDQVLAQCDEILNQLQMDYVDLLLIHWPSDDVPLSETIEAFNYIQSQGKAISIGVSNFSADLIDQAKALSTTPINVNQVPYHVRHQTPDLLNHCQKSNVTVTAYCPLGRTQILKEPLLTKIARCHNKSTAKVALLWLIQKDMIVIPKASSIDHLKANLDLFGWELSEDEVKQLDNIA
ncbi:TPA: aldo/keto reductase [Candidatus Poribacteria bacterium]|nr:aldo/keto reductase [Candidatus Poribacteria bacterium]HIC03381.1 aldo/keto reductase [Candidatus Poribacteria bacterium]HIM11173.1 aldo/keto reductase [Candidatus Poribacteria bacterium]